MIIWVQRNSAITFPVGWFVNSTSQTSVRPPRCTNVATPTTR